MGEGAFFDTGAGATWAEALLFPPWIADERDGTIFRNLPAIRFKQSLDAVEGRDNPEALPPVSHSFHDNLISDEGKPDHGA